MGLTISDIEEDIAGFQKRIEKAQARLRSLPVGRLPFKEHKKRERGRRDAQAEIKHVKQLIIYAREGIAIRQGEVKNNG